MYIIGLACISAQKTFDDSFWNGEVTSYAGDRYMAIEPGYGQLIPAGLLRRMGKAARMGVGTGLPLMQQWVPDGIILATAHAGVEDCLKFLNQIVDYDEGTLTPTNFVQSTPNAVAGNLAMMTKTTGYNNTHVHRGLAFEAALLDALLLFEEKHAECLLVGSVEEISDYNHNIDLLSGTFKEGVYTSETLFTSGTPGSVNGEGAAMFVVTREKKADAIARIVDVDQTSYLPDGNIGGRVQQFLERNALSVTDVNAVVLGISGDSVTDYLYDDLVQCHFQHCDLYTYKNLVGDHPTVSSWATWLAASALAGGEVPAACVRVKKNVTLPHHILVYNHHKGTQHGLILLSVP